MEKKNNSVIRVALIGPESTSKSTLSELLAKHYKTVWVKEYAREYLSNIKRKYTIDDVVEIAKEQLEQELQLIKTANRIIFVDTELIISKVWCLDVFKECPDWISENLIRNKYDFYLLTSPDLPWKEDALRENPHRRELLFDWYEKELKVANANYAVVKGVGDSRLKNSISLIEKYITSIQN